MLAGTTRDRGPIRVCFMIDRLTTAGTETQLLALIGRLDRARVLPFLCLLDGHEELSQALEPADCPVLRLGVRALHHPSTVLQAFRLGRFLQRQRIDVLQTYFQDSSYLGIPVARLAGVRRVVRTRNNLGYWITPLHRWLGWLCNLATDVVIANCIACREAVIADERVAPARVQVLENGVDCSRFPEWPRNGATAAGPRIGIVANLRPVKNLDLFLQAGAQVSSDFPRITLHLAGEGELRQNLEQLGRALGLGARIFFHGSVSDIPRFLAGLDIAVLCSRSEGMSNAVLEYMAAGKAIVATAVGATMQMIENNVHGLLVAPGDPAALANAIRRLLRDPALARHLGRNARRRAQQCYSREAMVRRFEVFYRELVDSSSAGGLGTRYP